MKNLIIAIALLSIVSCSSSKKTSDFDPETDFSAYTSYGFTDKTLNTGVKTLDKKRMLKAIENELQLKGYLPSENPDFLVELFSQTTQTTEVSKTEVKNPWRFGAWSGFEGTQTYLNTSTNGTLIISIIDNASQKMVWYGSSTRPVNEDASAKQKASLINSTVKKILKKYPSVK